MTAYLTAHPPASRQFYNPRRGGGRPLVIVVHTAENAPDTVGADGGAEAVARFIARRPDPGSYHVVVDSDSTVQLGEDTWEMFGSGKPSRGNRWMLHVSMATRAGDWDRLDPGRAAQMRWHAAKVTAQWCAAYGIPVRAASLGDVNHGISTGRPVGVCRHADLDPARRSDPGWNDTEFRLWLDLVADLAYVAQGASDMTPAQEAKLDKLAAEVAEIKARIAASEQTPPGPRWWIEQRVKAIDEAVTELAAGGADIDLDELAGRIADELAERLRA